ncbi:thermonuclease family protein [Tundrisphaera sp. TA3]|uniref:thermonuclease family protein n=1 Tax=Tundrisphaera sp. TA3 TaxID=3435775 RepID=UPI003EBDDDD4
MLFLLLYFLIPAAGLCETFKARVIHLSDGDTLTVLRDGKTQVKVRLHGVDAPETGQPFGSRAKQAASELAYGKQVTIREVDRDRYGRTVAEVTLPDGRVMGRELTGLGWAWWYREYAPADQALARLESEARAARRGLWADPNPVPPWDWRKGRGVPFTAEVVGNRRSHVYHLPHCRGEASMKTENRVAFKTAAEAEERGYRRAGDCHIRDRTNTVKLLKPNLRERFHSESNLRALS